MTSDKVLEIILDRVQHDRKKSSNKILLYFRHQKLLLMWICFCIQQKMLLIVILFSFIYIRVMMKKWVISCIGLDDSVRRWGWCFGAYAAVALMRSVVCEWNMRLFVCVILCCDMMRCRWHRKCWRLIQWSSRCWVVRWEWSQCWPHWWSSCSQLTPMWRHRMSHRR